MKRVLLTGCGGFIGAHCVRYWLEKTDWEIIGIDSFRHKGRVSRLKRCTDAWMLEGHSPDSLWSRFKIYTHDLTTPIDPALENLIMGRTIDGNGVVVEKPLHYIINMASDSAVERSTTDPVHCVRNNYELMVNMLEFARKIQPELFVQISTDEVYGEAPQTGPGHPEWATILPSNPYAASKAAQEALAIAYWRTYDLPVVITNTMNIIGEMQDCEKFLPKLIRNVAMNKEVPIYADQVGEEWRIGSRTYLDVRNKADALVFITKLAVAKYSQGAARPERYHIAGDTELDNLQLAKMVAGIMGRPLRTKLVSSESARPGYDRRYALDGSLLGALGWKPPIAFDETLRRVVDWTLNNQEWIL